MKNYIGIDLGGTNVRVAKISANGEVLQEMKSPSYGMDGPDKAIGNMISLIKKIDDYQSCGGIGIGVPGPVDTVAKVMKLSSNLNGFKDYPLGLVMEKELGMPIFIDNDANVAGLAEALVGAGKGHNIVYYVTISTGIGGAMIVDGKVVSGKSGYAGETGNLIIDPYRAPYNDLNPGAVESEASGRALIRKAQEELNDPTIEHAGQVFELAEKGNVIAMKLLDQMTTDLAIMFSQIAHIVDPSIFVIGGGMTKSKDHWLTAVIEKFKGFVHPGMRDVIFATAKLDEPGIIGAAMLPISKGQ